jgi:hypothetical protein
VERFDGSGQEVSGLRASPISLAVLAYREGLCGRGSCRHSRCRAWRWSVAKTPGVEVVEVVVAEVEVVVAARAVEAEVAVAVLVAETRLRRRLRRDGCDGTNHCGPGGRSTVGREWRPRRTGRLARNSRDHHHGGSDASA